MRSAAGVLLGSVILLAGSWVEAGCLHRLHGCCNRCGTQQIVVHVCKSGAGATTESARAPESAQQTVTYQPTRIVESYPVMQPVMQMASYTPMMMPQMMQPMPQMVTVQSPPARSESAPAPKDSCDCDRISARLDKLETDMDRLVDLIGKNSQAIERVAVILELNKKANKIDFPASE